ncbi:CCR4-NOT transcription complex subunit 10 isoform X2 [Halyomorpha halys]|uniref:CCR4-NOT transcription complex subunit 10 isoform X2 n=1 Tax=Halyomorpha halys TaxID=286706 RepID=UPI0006D4CD8B|nr:CCR4-NOT transcription complex subunit 10 isoform X2 [Halyomorpha halys]XP_014285904.1 CCR4-NOT transcription complex subunit 10 isoform X2 [Halyomorpha halys]
MPPKKMNQEEQKLASLAFSDFINKKYSLCLQHLTLLVSIKPNNLKILHNRIVAELYVNKNIDLFQKSLTNLCNQGRIDLFENETPDDVDHCIIYYNQAVIYYNQKQYEKALNLLNKIFSLIQPMEEWLAQKVCYLLVELCLLCNQADKGISNISYIENQFLPYKLMDETSNTPDSILVKRNSPSFKLNLLHYKARCLLHTRSYESCRKILDYIFSLNSQSFSTIMMKAQLSLLNMQYEDALNEIILIQEDVDNFVKLGDEKILIYFNNIATIYYYMRKPHLSSFFFNKAYGVYSFPKFKKMPKEVNFGKPVVFQPATFLQVMYNKGTALLFTMKPIEAFDCFTEAVQGMHKTPLIWLRLAECCIMAYKKDNEGLFNFIQNRKLLVNETVGSGLQKKIVLNSKLYKDSAFSSDPQSFAVPVPTLEFATICLRNSYVLLPPGSNSKLKQAVLAACSYVHLTIGDPLKAHKYAAMLYADATCHVYKYLGKLYLAESLVLLNKFQEAIDVLNPSQFNECDPSQEVQKHDWFPKSQLSSQAVLYYNLAAVLTMNGEIEKASDLLKHIWVLKGSRNEVPVHIIALALYIELVLGDYEIARTIIRQNCPQVCLLNN